ncbi:MAG: hydantoinase/oxoprolinase family protein [Magnetospirillum sp.]|jgi:N-methylhydantoinase A|nr:hydantoinase/oxoprolinase family protein [Magnetospirillum sp.]
MLWIGIDVGGTFTDAVAYDDVGKSFAYAKASSTPSDPTIGVIDVLDLLKADMANVERFVHGVTIGTNAILEGKGAECWMLVTKGFKDVLEIGRTNRPVLYNIRSQKKPPLIPRTRTREVDERLLYDGTVLQKLNESDVAVAVSDLPKHDNLAVAVCFLHSYINPEHERAAKAALASALPDAFVCTSSDVLPQFREYERFNTTALNAYIGPLMRRYLSRLKSSLESKGFRRDLYIMTSNGGVSTAERAKQLPVATVLSGPAGGVAAAVHLGGLLDVPNIITCDMGGTSTDVCLIENLRIPVTNEQKIAEYANRTPQIEINAVGAGGGSIGWIDSGEILMVGPQSAGAAPGPACYGRGGTQPTVTDANLVLNRLAAESPLAGGRIKLDPELSMRALKPLAERLGLDEIKLADGIIRIAVARMVSAIKQISIANGFDPREFTLLPYGGAGPMHSVAIAEELEIPRVLVPLGPGNFAAFGSLISDIRRDYVRTRTMHVTPNSWNDLDAAFADIELQATKDLIAEGVPEDRIRMRRSAGMRFLGQSWELNVELGQHDKSIDRLIAAFGEVHERRFGHRSGTNVEIVNFRVTAVGLVDKPGLHRLPTASPRSDAYLRKRDVFFNGDFVATPVVQRDRLVLNETIIGPAVIEESGSTTVLPPGWKAVVLAHGELMLERI